MSNLEPVATLPDWRARFSQYLSGTDNAITAKSFEQSTTSNGIFLLHQKPLLAPRPPLEHRHSLAQLRKPQDSVTAIGRPESAPPAESRYSTANTMNPESESTTQSGLSVTSNSTLPSLAAKAQISANDEMDTNEDEIEEYDEDEENYIHEPEDVSSGGTKSEAERRAERRKMKRFRLTHQQTRFLMSEFAKHAHPDAAHRERLAREIPGLSPRQVQVWFQNRRAKIKRLTADDRERMMKMRAVPDDFDNVQALHSTYGAVSAISPPLQSPVDYMPSIVDRNMMHPLMVDTMKNQGNNEHIASTGLSPAFGQTGFASPVSHGTSDGLPNLSVPSSDRYYSTRPTNSLNVGPRNTDIFNCDNSAESYHAHGQSREQSQPSQPIHLLETISTTRSESLQIPPRSGASWKADSLDYTNYNSAFASPIEDGRQLMYYTGHPGVNSIGTSRYGNSNYSESNAHASSQPLVYPDSSKSTLKHSDATISRRQPTSSVFSLGLELQVDHATQSTHHSSQISSSTPRITSITNAYLSTGGFPSAPLTAPTEFQFSRMSMDSNQRESFLSQLSAPMAPPPDFTTAYSQSVMPGCLPPSQQSLRQPSDAIASRHQQHQQQNVESAHYMQQHEDQSTQQPGFKRKRGYSMPRNFEMEGQ